MEVGNIRKFGYRVNGNIVSELAQIISTNKVTSGLKVIEVEFQDGIVRKYSLQHLPKE